MSDPYTGFGDLKFSQDDHSTAAFIAKQMLNGMATAALVLVKAVHADTVDVQPLVHQIDGAGTGIPHGIIHALPFFTLRAGNAAVIAKPVIGDIGVAVFCQSDSSVVKKTKAPANPGSRRRFDWADGLYLGGFLGPVPTTVITVVDGEIDITATTIKLTGDVQIIGNVEITGDQSASGTITGTTDVVGGGKSLKTHIHSDPQGGSTGAPS